MSPLGNHCQVISDMPLADRNKLASFIVMLADPDVETAGRYAQAISVILQHRNLDLHDLAALVLPPPPRGQRH